MQADMLNELFFTQYIDEKTFHASSQQFCEKISFPFHCICNIDRW